MITAQRYMYLKAHPEYVQDTERKEFNSLQLWEKRSSAAKRAVATKRARYKTWPTRKGGHKR